MKAMVFDRFGGPEVLYESDVDTPEPGPGQVRLRVRAAGVNPADGQLRQGLMQTFFPISLPAVPGVEAAGTVDAVGEGVTGLAVGDDVFGFTGTELGAFAEYALAAAGNIFHKPAGLAWEAAAALPVAAETSERVLQQLAIRAGDTVLIHGASGAVGTLAVQLAVRRGAMVIGTASEANHPHLAALGAIPTTYGEGLVERVCALAPNGIDAVFDVAGRGALADSIELRGGTDRIITIADSAGAKKHGISLSSSGSSLAGPNLPALAVLAASGELKITVGSVYPLADAAAAQAVVDKGHARGKVVLIV
ncbi:NADP-dependent oxidoreductase [Streptomyces mirabilis]|uniref:NADP-dependent oxidoreductase n=1 Tax=Streptomyces mirabilis TaxID=68239 RepID=UPI0036F00979